VHKKVLDRLKPIWVSILHLITTTTLLFPANQKVFRGTKKFTAQKLYANPKWIHVVNRREWVDEKYEKVFHSSFKKIRTRRMEEHTWEETKTLRSYLVENFFVRTILHL